MDRHEQILKIVRLNAEEALDQGQIEDYRDNMLETIAGQFPDWTNAECAMAEDEYARLTKAGA